MLPPVLLLSAEALPPLKVSPSLLICAVPCPSFPPQTGTAAWCWSVTISGSSHRCAPLAAPGSQPVGSRSQHSAPCTRPDTCNHQGNSSAGSAASPPGINGFRGVPVLPCPHPPMPHPPTYPPTRCHPLPLPLSPAAGVQRDLGGGQGHRQQVALGHRFLQGAPAQVARCAEQAERLGLSGPPPPQALW